MSQEWFDLVNSSRKIITPTLFLDGMNLSKSELADKIVRVVSEAYRVGANHDISWSELEASYNKYLLYKSVKPKNYLVLHPNEKERSAIGDTIFLWKLAVGSAESLKLTGDKNIDYKMLYSFMKLKDMNMPSCLLSSLVRTCMSQKATDKRVRLYKCAVSFDWTKPVVTLKLVGGHFKLIYSGIGQDVKGKFPLFLTQVGTSLRLEEKL